MKKEINDYLRLANMMNKKTDCNLERAKETADNWSIAKLIDYAVVKNGGWQIWAKSIADKCGRDYVYSTSVSTGVGDSDSDGL
jgi:hypothetical protein